MTERIERPEGTYIIQYGRQWFIPREQDSTQKRIPGLMPKFKTPLSKKARMLG